MATPEHLFFVEMGMGTDLHGQNVTKAAVRAVWQAMLGNSLPGIEELLPGGDPNEMKVNVVLGVPAGYQDDLDKQEVIDQFPYGTVTVEIQTGGLLTPSGVILADKGDKKDEIVAVVVAVEVGY